MILRGDKFWAVLVIRTENHDSIHVTVENKTRVSYVFYDQKKYVFNTLKNT
jgi:hypothetical protein